ncbi:MAG: hypothetical protein RLZZ368_109, partial [Actinomycetota bacterium]
RENEQNSHHFQRAQHVLIENQSGQLVASHERDYDDRHGQHHSGEEQRVRKCRPATERRDSGQNQPAEHRACRTPTGGRRCFVRCGSSRRTRHFGEATQRLLLGLLGHAETLRCQSPTHPSPTQTSLAPCENEGVTSDGTSVSTLHWSDTNVEVHKLVVGPYDNNVFVVRCRSTGDAALIDAANEHEKLLEISSRLGVRRVLETHGHHDHIQAIPAMREAGYEVAVTALDAPMLGDLGYDVFLEHDDVIEVGRLRLHAIHSPGHTPGSISFHVENTPLLFTGDTLFPGGPGATKFPGGDFETIIRSIDNLLFVHPADTIVLPGHGHDTTIGAERPHLQEWVDRGW